jgi:ankyrin repeat protein
MLENLKEIICIAVRMEDKYSEDLCIACKTGDLKQVQYWLDQGVNIDSAFKGSDGAERTPLQYAVTNGHFDVVQLLLASGADVNKGRIDSGTTPLLAAAWNGYAEIIRVLISFKADINQVRTDIGVTPLFFAAQQGHLEVVRLLIDSQVDVNKATLNDGATPLFIAAWYGHLEIVKILIDSKADVNQTNKYGISPLFIAAQNGHLEVVQLLVDSKADINQISMYNTTPLSVSAKNGHLAIVKLLLEQNADSAVLDTLGYTALIWAVTVGYDNIVALLSGFDFSTISKPIINKTNRIENTRGYKGEEKEEIVNSPIIDHVALQSVDIILEHKLGSGNFGDVWRGIYYGAPVAVKFLHKASEEAITEIVEELSLLGYKSSYSNY